MHVDVVCTVLPHAVIFDGTQKTPLHPGYPDTGEQGVFHSSLGERETAMPNK